MKKSYLLAYQVKSRYFVPQFLGKPSISLEQVLGYFVGSEVNPPTRGDVTIISWIKLPLLYF